MATLSLRQTEEADVGLRELKKEQTRKLIAAAAWRLFTSNGFDKVTVAEIAREAQVAEATVFNYFSSKEDLFNEPLEIFATRLTDAVRDRPPGETALAAYRRALETDTGGLLVQIQSGDREALDRLRTVNRIVNGSPALLARERLAMSRIAVTLAAELTGERDPGTGVTIGPQVVANALVGLHRALIGYVRDRIQSGDDVTELYSEVRKLTADAFELLALGIGDYAPKP